MSLVIPEDFGSSEKLYKRRYAMENVISEAGYRELVSLRRELRARIAKDHLSDCQVILDRFILKLGRKELQKLKGVIESFYSI